LEETQHSQSSSIPLIFPMHSYLVMCYVICAIFQRYIFKNVAEFLGHAGSVSFVGEFHRYIRECPLYQLLRII
jgi:positive regulator of sigma E activity